MQLVLPLFDVTPRRARRPPAIATRTDRAPAADPGINEQILAATRRVTLQATRLFGTDLTGWAVHCDLRGMMAGQVQIHRRRIRFNPEMAASQPQAFLTTTIAHEVAHVVCHLLHGRRARPHGKEWRDICLALGGDGLRCHEFAATPARRLPSFIYACGCRTWSISSIRVRRMRRGLRYHCRACGEPLRPGA